MSNTDMLTQAHHGRRTISKGHLFFKADSSQQRINLFSEQVLFHRCRLRINQTQFGQLVGLTQPQVSMLEAGEIEPAPMFVFEMETRIGLEPGTLSQHLGYAPGKAVHDG